MGPRFELISKADVSEEVRSNPGVSVNLRPVSCIQISDSGSLFIGDHGCNLKLLDWRTNHLSKAGNHQGDIGFTDCLSRGEEQLLIASTFHIDSGYANNQQRSLKVTCHELSGCRGGG